MKALACENIPDREAALWLARQQLAQAGVMPALRCRHGTERALGAVPSVPSAGRLQSRQEWAVAAAVPRARPLPENTAW